MKKNCKLFFFKITFPNGGKGVGGDGCFTGVLFDSPLGGWAIVSYNTACEAATMQLINLLSADHTADCTTEYSDATTKQRLCFRKFGQVNNTYYNRHNWHVRLGNSQGVDPTLAAPVVPAYGHLGSRRTRGKRLLVKLLAFGPDGIGERAPKLEDDNRGKPRRTLQNRSCFTASNLLYRMYTVIHFFAAPFHGGRNNTSVNWGLGSFSPRATTKTNWVQAIYRLRSFKSGVMMPIRSGGAAG